MLIKNGVTLLDDTVDRYDFAGVKNNAFTKPDFRKRHLKLPTRSQHPHDRRLFSERLKEHTPPRF